jgi:endogenous inhibitor of DNA gyrase (YacG/DUF329 family)
MTVGSRRPGRVTVDQAEERRQVVAGVCPRCGSPVPRPKTGRPATWCSQACRRAAYEERRAARSGAVAVEFVDRVRAEGVRHSREDCLTTVLDSPVATARFLGALLRKLTVDGELWDPRWARTCEVLSRSGWVLDSARRTGR